MCVVVKQPLRQSCTCTVQVPRLTSPSPGSRLGKSLDCGTVTRTATYHPTQTNLPKRPSSPLGAEIENMWWWYGEPVQGLSWTWS